MVHYIILIFKTKKAYQLSVISYHRVSRSHALRGNAFKDAPRPATQSVAEGIPTQSVGTRKN